MKKSLIALAALATAGFGIGTVQRSTVVRCRRHQPSSARRATLWAVT